MQFQDQQQLIVDSEENQIVVSSSAGCGKTTTMIKKIMWLLCHKKIDVDKILCLTFTNNAGFEMKQKLAKAIFESDKLSTAQKQKNLLLLENADICTIDSFCNKLVKKYFYLENISQNYEIMDDSDHTIMKNNVLETVLQEYYNSKDEDFFTLFDIFSNDRTPRLLNEFILKIYELQMLYPNDILTDFVNMSSAKDNPSLDFVTKLYLTICKEFENHFSSIETKYFPSNDALEIMSFVEILQNQKGDFFEIAKNKPYFARTGNLTAKDKQDSIKVFNHEVFKSTKADFKKFVNSFFEKFFERDNLTESFEQCQILSKKLVEITQKFTDKLFERKVEKAKFSFGDIEKIAYHIVCSDKADFNFQSVFIDEAQDLNILQDSILKKVSNGCQTFLVGDAKQCIYRFRGSEPKIFEDAKKSCDALYKLSKNYRTNKDILQFVNAVFEKLMFEEFGMANYLPKNKNDLGEMLQGDVSGIVDDGKMPVVVCKTAEYKDEKQQVSTAYDNELIQIDSAKEQGKYVANEISNLLYSKINENGVKRNIKLSDIAVLVRGKKEYSTLIKDCLIETKIPVFSNFEYNATDDFYVNLLINFLKIVDNFYDDIALAGTLSIQFNSYEIACIKLFSQKEKLQTFAQNFEYFVHNGEGELHEKATLFFQKICMLKSLSQYCDVRELCNNILLEFDLETYASINGSAKGIHNFLQKIDGKNYSNNLVDFLFYLQTNDIKLTDEKSNADSVFVTTIHKAKGLEYPIVFLVGLENNINFSERNNTFTLSKNLGIGMEFYDTFARIKQPTALLNSIKLESKFNQIIDEINILYVAMTRAKYRLYLFFGGEIPTSLNKYNFLEQKCYRDMLFGGLANQSMYQFLETNSFVNLQKPTEKLIKFSEKTDENLQKYINFAYKKPQNVLAKATATELLKRQDQEENITKLFDFEQDYLPKTNNFVDNLSIGIIYHKFLQYCKNPYVDICVEKEIYSQIEKGLLKKQEAQLLDIDKLATFFKIVYQKPCKKILLEQEFVANLTAESLGLYGGQKDVLVQGKIDLIQIFDDKIVIVDYKFSRKNEENLKNSYKKQLQVYSAVLSKIWKKKVESFLYSFELGKLIKLDK